MKFWFKRTLSKTFPTLETKYQEQIKKDSETIATPTKVLVILLVFMETLRVTISEVLLKGAIGWQLVEVYFGFAILLSIALIGRDWFSKKLSFKRKGWGMIRPLFLLLYCGVISYTLVRQMKTYKHDMRDERDEFDFIAFGLIVIPNLLVSDILFNNWLMKCILPAWQLLTLAIVLIVYRPLNLAALLFMIFEYLLYIIMIFWVKDKLTWKIFLQRTTAAQWNQIHSEILKNIPDNVAVYDFYGKLLFENDFFKKLQETFGPIDILKSIKSIKIRQFPKSFKLPPTVRR